MNNQKPRSPTQDQLAINKRMLACVRKYGSTKIDEVLDLLSKGADINSQDINGQTSLILASQVGDTKMVSFLLSHLANPNLKDIEGNTALHLAYCSVSSPQVVEILLDGGAQLEEKNAEGFTPFTVLTEMIYDHYLRESRALVIMFERGADVLAKTSKGTACADLILAKPEKFRELAPPIQAKLDKEVITHNLTSTGAPNRIAKL